MEDYFWEFCWISKGAWTVEIVIFLNEREFDHVKKKEWDFFQNKKLLKENDLSGLTRAKMSFLEYRVSVWIGLFVKLRRNRKGLFVRFNEIKKEFILQESKTHRLKH